MWKHMSRLVSTTTTAYISAKGSVTADQAISICADLGTIQPGGQQTFVYYTSLDADFEDALDQIENQAEYVIRASAGAGGTIDPIRGDSGLRGWRLRRLPLPPRLQT